MFTQTRKVLPKYKAEWPLLFAGEVGFLFGGASTAEAVVTAVVAISVVLAFELGNWGRLRVSGGVV